MCLISLCRQILKLHSSMLQPWKLTTFDLLIIRMLQKSIHWFYSIVVKWNQYLIAFFFFYLNIVLFYFRFFNEMKTDKGIIVCIRNLQTLVYLYLGNIRVKKLHYILYMWKVDFNQNTFWANAVNLRTSLHLYWWILKITLFLISNFSMNGRQKDWILFKDRSFFIVFNLFLPPKLSLDF